MVRVQKGVTRKSIECILILGVVANLLGCGPAPFYKAYRGKKKLSNVALIQCDSEHAHGISAEVASWLDLQDLPSDRRLYITKIDGKSTSSNIANIHIGFPEQVLVEPGRHSLGLKFVCGTTSCDGKLWLDAEAGKTYFVYWKSEGYHIRFWIEEKESGKVVSGSTRGGESKPEK